MERKFMRIRPFAACCAAALVMGVGCSFTKLRAAAHSALPTQAQEDAPAGAHLKPEVASLIKQSTAVYAAMKSYRHISENIIKGQTPDGEINHTITYTLALERPNKFCYKSDAADSSAAVSDGKTFINYRNDTTSGPRQQQRTYYTRTSAPTTYKGINIVDDVTFIYGTYMIALMLQGDVLADEQVKSGLEHATLQAGVTENGRKYDVLSVPFSDPEAANSHPFVFYFDSVTHLLRKTVSVEELEGSHPGSLKVTEIIENVLIDKPIPPATFEYTPPKNARLIVGLPAHYPSSRRIVVARAVPMR